MNKKKIALILNIIILVLELIGFGKSIFVDHNIAIEYYTNDSNLLALISSLLFIIFYKKDKELVKDISFVSTSCLTVTILVVIFVLCPMYKYNYKLLMFTNEFLIFHTLVPIISIISYVAFEDKSSKNYLGLAFTIIYSIIFSASSLIFISLSKSKTSSM